MELVFLTYPDGKKYVGEFEYGEFNGKGTLTFSDGRSYVGEFRDNKQNGAGVLTHPDGYKYVGGFKNGLRYGSATILFGNGKKYVGEINAGYFHGRGILSSPDGLEYIGEFVFDKYNGRGFLSYPDGEILEGIFQDGQYCGKDQDFVNEVEANEGGICEKSRINISYLFFDTETTGLPKDYDGPVTDLNNWPRLVQLAYIAFDRDGNIIAEENFIVQPDGFSIPKDATKVHGITTAVAKKEGIPLDTVLEIFSSLVEEADYLVAHNIAFDEKIIGAEFIRNGMENSIPFKRKICTMKSTKDYCAINGPYGFKWPTLSELYYKLFGTYFDEAHNAAADIEATAECFWELRSRKLI